jgi:hypothetical protein
LLLTGRQCRQSQSQKGHRANICLYAAASQVYAEGVGGIPGKAIPSLAGENLHSLSCVPLGYILLCLCITALLILSVPES